MMMSKRSYFPAGLALACLASIASSARAQISLIPALVPIEEDDAVLDIKAAKQLYARLTSNDWRPAATLTAPVGDGEAKRYPKPDFFCKQLGGPSDIHFTSSKKGTDVRLMFARIDRIDCQSGTAATQGIYLFSDGSMAVGQLAFSNQSYVLGSRLDQSNSRQVFVYRTGDAGKVGLAAVAGPEGATMVTLEDKPLYGYQWMRRDVYSSSRVPDLKVQTGFLIPGIGYVHGKSSMGGLDIGGDAIATTTGDMDTTRLGWSYGIFYALDDSFRIIGPIHSESSWASDSFSSGWSGFNLYKPPSENPKIVIAEIPTISAFADAPPGREKIALHMGRPTYCGDFLRECRPIFIETKMTTKLGPPGLYQYHGPVDLTKAPHLDTMVAAWRSSMTAGTVAIHHADELGTGDFPTKAALDAAQAKIDAHIARGLAEPDAEWAENDRQWVKGISEFNQAYEADYADMLARRREDDRQRTAGHAAIMGAIADLGASARRSAQELDETRALVDYTNAVTAGGASANNQPYVAPPLTDEQRQLLASRWGRGGARAMGSNGGRGTSAASSSSAGSRDGAAVARITEAEAMAVLTGGIYVNDAGASVKVTGGRR